MSYKSKPLPLEFCCAATERKLFPEDRGNEIALCGRSNSGKSTLINSIANQKKLAKTSNTPGRTQSINFFTFKDNMDKKIFYFLGAWNFKEEIFIKEKNLLKKGGKFILHLPMPHIYKKIKK